MCIRNLDLKDEAEKNRVVDIVNQCYRGRDGWTNEAHLVVGPRLTVERLENDSQVFSFFVAEHRHSGIIGCIKTGIVKETFFGPLSEPSGFAGVLAVLPKFQGQGVGSQLLSFSEAFCRGKGVPQMVSTMCACFSIFLTKYILVLKRCPSDFVVSGYGCS